MPQNQGELRDLFALLAKFQKSLLACIFVEQFGYVGHGPAVVLRHIGVVTRGVLVDGIQSVGMIGRVRDTVELGSLVGSGGGGGLLLYLVVMCLLVHPGGGFLGIVMLAVHWVIGHHLGGGGRRLVINRFRGPAEPSVGAGNAE